MIKFVWERVQCEHWPTMDEWFTLQMVTINIKWIIQWLFDWMMDSTRKWYMDRIRALPHCRARIYHSWEISLRTCPNCCIQTDCRTIICLVISIHHSTFQWCQQGSYSNQTNLTNSNMRVVCSSTKPFAITFKAKQDRRYCRYVIFTFGKLVICCESSLCFLLGVRSSPHHTDWSL